METRVKPHLSLRAQGIVLLMMGATLMAAYGAFLLLQKERLRASFEELNAEQEVEGRLYRLASDIGQLSRAVDTTFAIPQARDRVPTLETQLGPVREDLQRLPRDFPALRAQCDKLFILFDAMRRDFSLEDLRLVSVQLHATADEADRVIDTVSSRRKKLSDNWFHANMAVAAASAAASLLALVGFGSAALFFLSRLTSDVRKLSASASKIALGQPYEPLTVTRRDEVGELMQAMNSMAARLTEREKQLVIARQQYFHAEKMIAVRSLAAGVAHEIGNPLEAISTVAQAIADAKEQSCESRGQRCHPQLILEQIRRVSNITRDLSNLSGPSQPDAKLQNLNDLIRDTCRFMRYDRRYRQIELAVDLDAQLPAVRIVGDQFAQVLMNLLINAADAFDAGVHAAPRVAISTRMQGAAILLQVEDNGSGMDQATLKHAFEPFYTTKGAGSGLGLAVCKSIVEAYGGTLDLESAPGLGTCVKVTLPPERLAQPAPRDRTGADTPT